MGVYQKLAEVQKDLKAPKNQYNKFGKYNYRSCEDIMEAAKPLCIANGLVLIVSDEIKNIGNRYYVEATASVVDIEDNKPISAKASAREAESQSGMAAPQVTGSTSSYARKYALNGLFGIDDTKDDDTKDKPKKDETPKTEAPTEVTKVSVQQLQAAMDKKGITVKQMLATYKKDAPEAKTCTDIAFLPQEYKLKYYKMCL